jgi:hypothetical protein
MIIKKHIEIAMNIQDCIGLYTDVYNNLKNMIIDRYKGRCLRQSYILDILDIIKYSDCVINQDGMPDFGVINVIFEAMVIVYTPGEIINNCRVVSNEVTSPIICSAPYTDVVISRNQMLNSIQVDQIISVRVHKVKYTIGGTKMTVSAVLLTPTKTPTLYEYVPSTLPDDFMDYISNITNNIKEILSDTEKLPKKNYEFFRLMLHAYKDEQKSPKDVYVDLLQLIESAPTSKCYIGRDPRLFPTSNIIYMSDNIEDIGRDDVNVIHDLAPEQIFATLLDEYCNNIRTVFEIVKIYESKELMESHRNLWMIYGAIKNAK